jgi:hypothetical protein
MRWLAVVVVVGLGIVASAAAQDGAAARWAPEWEQRPSARDFANSTPDSVALNGVTAVVQLCCTPGQARSLACRVGFESPRDQGFGSASLRIARRFRLTPGSDAVFRADPNAWLQIPIVYRRTHVSPEITEALERIRTGTHGLCAPPGADPGPLLEPIVVTVG